MTASTGKDIKEQTGKDVLDLLYLIRNFTIGWHRRKQSPSTRVSPVSAPLVLAAFVPPFLLSL